jgi:hypothetical protein
MLRRWIFVNGLLIFSISAVAVNCGRNKWSPKTTNPFPGVIEGSYLGLVDKPPITTEQIVDYALLFTVELDGVPSSKGSGVCIGKKLGLTNWHVVDGALVTKKSAQLKVRLKNRKSSRVTRVALDFAYFDTAVVEFADPVCPDGAPIHNPSTKFTDDPLQNVSNPLDSEFKSFSGKLISPTSQALGAQESSLIGWVPLETQVLASQELAQNGVTKGSSGSAVFQNGRMLGLVFAGNSEKDKVLIIDTSFLTLKPFAEFEWIGANFTALKERMTDIPVLTADASSVIPMPQSFVVKIPTSVPSKSHPKGSFAARIEKMVSNPIAVLTYRRGEGLLGDYRTFCWIRARNTPDGAGLVVANVTGDTELKSCKSITSAVTQEEAFFADENDDGVADSTSVGN